MVHVGWGKVVMALGDRLRYSWEGWWWKCDMRGGLLHVRVSRWRWMGVK